ncbi:MAG: SDR family NAD(P)-dependent oxidoreductase [Pseudomonadales bacterium]
MDIDKSVLLIGCGDLATRAGLQLITEGFKVTAVRRNTSLLPAEFDAMPADITRPETLLKLQGRIFDLAIISLTPDGRSEDDYRQVYLDGLKKVLSVLSDCPPALTIFVSSTSVYHQNDGEWVDECSTTVPRRFNGQVMLEAEQLIQTYCQRSIILRLGGIYGPERIHLLRQVVNGDRCEDLTAAYSNRIHIEDAARILVFLGLQSFNNIELASCYLGVDSTPVLLTELVNWLADELALDTVSGRHIRRSSANRQCSNKRLLDSGFILRYPDYKSGYRQVLALNQLAPE